MIDAFTKPVDTDCEELDERFDTDPKGVYLPSREQIAQECAAIRRHWSEREHRKRSAAEVWLRWHPPTIHLEADPRYYLNE